MKKKDVLDLFGGNLTEASRQLGINRQAIYQWPEDVPFTAILRVRNWFLETQGSVPAKWMPKRRAA
jgi:hypothetical protein